MSDEREQLERMMYAFLGKDGVAMITEDDEWKEFSPFDEKCLELHARAMKAMKRGEIDLKNLLEINNDFNFFSETFLRQTRIRETEDGEPISYWDIFGGAGIPRPEYAAYELAKFMMIIVAQKKIIKKLMEKQGKDMSAKKLTIIQ